MNWHSNPGLWSTSCPWYPDWLLGWFHTYTISADILSLSHAGILLHGYSLEFSWDSPCSAWMSCGRFKMLLLLLKNCHLSFLEVFYRNAKFCRWGTFQTLLEFEFFFSLFQWYNVCANWDKKFSTIAKHLPSQIKVVLEHVKIFFSAQAHIW